MKTITTKRYYNENGIDITSRIDEGKTKVFCTRAEAQELANKNRTYIFEVFEGTPSGHKLIGFGVPV